MSENKIAIDRALEMASDASPSSGRVDPSETLGGSGGPPLGVYLTKRLYEAGAADAFVVAGDFVLGLLNYVEASPLRMVCCCNELNAAYAADGYARLKGLGVVVTTHAVGELSAINGVAGACSESVPVVMLVGSPARKFYKDRPLLHHTLGDYHIPKKMYEMITCASAFLDDPETAAEEIDRVINAALLYKKPVYLSVPSDMVNISIRIPSKLPRRFTPLPLPTSDPAALQECAEEIASRLREATRPLFIPGVELIRRRLQPHFKALTEKTGIPYVTMLLSKGLLSESHQHFIGLYSGQRSRPDVTKAVAESDCLVFIGEKLTDFNTGGFTVPMEITRRVLVSYDSVTVRAHTFQRVYIWDLIQKLVDIAPENDGLRYPISVASKSCIHRPITDPSSDPSSEKAEDKKRDTQTPADSQMSPYPDDKELTMHSFFARIAKVLPKEAVVIAETGSSLFSLSETMLTDQSTFIGQTFYGSIGFSVGAALGACIGVERIRKEPGSSNLVHLFVGDGSFQLTAQEVSTMIRYNLRPIIWLINNDGYTIERVITDNVYNDIQMWKYHQLPQIFGGNTGVVAKTHRDLRLAIQNIKDDPDHLHFVEIILDKWDCNQLLKDTGRLMAINNSLPPNDLSKIHRVDSSRICSSETTTTKVKETERQDFSPDGKPPKIAKKK